MKVLDLFSGIGGFSLGLERAGMETVAFCEADAKCRLVLKKHWPEIPIHEDIKKLDGRQYRGAIDLVCGGFPCQPFSVAGQRKGTADDRDLWPQMFRVIQEVRPAWVIGENVAGFVNMAFERTAIDLEGEGYEVQPLIIPACGVGAPHRRERVWIVANSKGKRDRRNPATIIPEKAEFFARKEQIQPRDSLKRSGKDACNTSSKGLPDWAGGTVGQPSPVTEFERPSGREIERDFCGIPHGIPGRVDRLKQLGNAVVPQIVEIIGRAIMEVHG